MPSQDPDYYRSRAQFERRRGADAQNERIAAAHEHLAELYDELVATLEQRATAANVFPLSPRVRLAR